MILLAHAYLFGGNGTLQKQISAGIYLSKLEWDSDPETFERGAKDMNYKPSCSAIFFGLFLHAGGGGGILPLPPPPGSATE